MYPSNLIIMKNISSNTNLTNDVANLLIAKYNTCNFILEELIYNKKLDIGTLTEIMSLVINTKSQRYLYDLAKDEFDERIKNFIY